MAHLRTYGRPPYAIAVVHGGPGAGGEMAPVARELSSGWSVLEPIQTATTLEGQVAELRTVLATHADVPVTLIGYSWGAWLGTLVAARHPALVGKLILVSSGPFEHAYAAALSETRLSRLGEGERAEWQSILTRLQDPDAQDKDAALARLGDLAHKTDAFDPLPHESSESDRCGRRGDIFSKVWAEAAAMRKSGALLDLASQVACPVVAIHGDHDPHPAEGVRNPLSVALPDFRFILLERCGHTPWLERQARERFYAILREELGLAHRSAG